MVQPARPNLAALVPIACHWTPQRHGRMRLLAGGLVAARLDPGTRDWGFGGNAALPWHCCATKAIASSLIRFTDMVGGRATCEEALCSNRPPQTAVPLIELAPTCHITGLHNLSRQAARLSNSSHFSCLNVATCHMCHLPAMPPQRWPHNLLHLRLSRPFAGRHPTPLGHGVVRGILESGCEQVMLASKQQWLGKPDPRRPPTLARGGA
jgi:hypothetical protein